MSAALLVIAWLALVIALYLTVLKSAQQARVQNRLAEEHRAQFEPEVMPVPDMSMPWLKRWLFLAGFRRPEAPHVFLLFAVVGALLALLTVVTIRNSQLMVTAMGWLDGLPGGIGVMFAPILVFTPWFLGLLIAIMPWLQVRSGRRKRVREVEEDLPLTLQILATLARAGLGFDASLVRVLESSASSRVLPQEFSTFRRELLSGMSRTNAWRRLEKRLEVPSISVFVSAMVHTEQVGGGLSGVLEHQAQDVQSRRRERALVQAQALPVKLVFPLVLCFLPGIFVWTLGPAFYQFIQVLDGVMRQGSAAPLP